MGYTLVNACLCDLRSKCDTTWTLCVKESVAAVGMGLWLIHRAVQGKQVLAPPRVLGVLVIAGLLTNVVGNWAVMWAMGVVGLAVSVPASLGANLVTSALLGKWMLGEGVSWRSVLAMVLLFASVILLGLGAGETNDAIAAKTQEGATGPLWVLLGVAAPCLAGVIYALLAVAIRSSVTGKASVELVVCLIPATGVLSLGLISLYRLDTASLLATEPAHLATMLFAGVVNLAAFLAVTKGFQLASVVHVNAVTASQVAMAAVAGLFFFKEPISLALVLGVVLTIVSVAMIGQSGRRDEEMVTEDPVFLD